MSDAHLDNKDEWKNPANWSGPKWLALYFSKKDTRLWVPKKNPMMGWTLNFGHDSAGMVLILFIMFIVLAPTLALYLEGAI